MSQEQILAGIFGAEMGLALQFYTTGILMHYTMFGRESPERYVDQLQGLGTFEVLLLTTFLFGVLIIMAGIARIVGMAGHESIFLAAFLPLFLGMASFVWQVNRITRSVVI